jgi:purine nucleosidase
MSSDRRRFVIDTDTASDDAVALLMALREPSVDVIAITVVAGNVPLDLGVQNALYCVELAGADVPVYAGAAAPLIQPLHTAQFVHGQDGMGDIGLELTGRVPAEGHAVDRLIELADANDPGELTLITLGPLTNVALAFARRPDIAGRFREIVMMGGTSDGFGNITAAAEFNIWVDPEAAAMVFGSGANLAMVGWDISRKYAMFTPREASELAAVGPLGKFSVDIQAVLSKFVHDTNREPGFDLPDPIAMGYALDPAIATATTNVNVVIETRGEYTRGMTVCDHMTYTGRAPNCTVVLEASHEAFVAQLHRLLGG